MWNVIAKDGLGSVCSLSAAQSSLCSKPVCSRTSCDITHIYWFEYSKNRRWADGWLILTHTAILIPDEWISPDDIPDMTINHPTQSRTHSIRHLSQAWQQTLAYNINLVVFNKWCIVSVTTYKQDNTVIAEQAKKTSRKIEVISTSHGLALTWFDIYVARSLRWQPKTWLQFCLFQCRRHWRQHHDSF